MCVYTYMYIYIYMHVYIYTSAHIYICIYIFGHVPLKLRSGNLNRVTQGYAGIPWTLYPHTLLVMVEHAC